MLGKLLQFKRIGQRQKTFPHSAMLSSSFNLKKNFLKALKVALSFNMTRSRYTAFVQGALEHFSVLPMRRRLCGCTLDSPVAAVFLDWMFKVIEGLPFPLSMCFYSSLKNIKITIKFPQILHKELCLPPPCIHSYVLAVVTPILSHIQTIH